MITLLLASILGVTLAGYLYWVRSQNLLVAESQAWNSALALAEAGIEEGLAQINVNVGSIENPTAVANYAPSVQTNFGPLGAVSPGVYGPRSNALPNGSYSVTITPPANPSLTLGPTITAVGYTKVPLISKPIARTVQVTTTIKALLANTITALSNVTFKGTGLTVDSYDSSDPNHSTNGFYNAATRKAGGDVASLFGVIGIQNANIFGHLETGPAASYTIGNGQVGDLPQNWPAQSGIEPGWWLTDFNMDIPDILPPYQSGTLPPSGSGTNTWILGASSYYCSGDFTINNNQTLYVSGNATFYVKGSFKMKNNTGSFISIAPGATLTLYVGDSSGAAVSADLGMVNTAGNASTFKFYGLPTLKTITWNGNAAYLGTIYAPEAYFILGGGGSTPYDFQGSTTVQTIDMNGHFNLHYDENLKRIGPSSGFIVTSWRELP